MNNIVVKRRTAPFGRSGGRTRQSGGVSTPRLSRSFQKRSPVKDGHFYIGDKDEIRQIRGNGNELVIAPDNKPFPGVPSEKIATSSERKDKLLRLQLFCQIRDKVRDILDLQSHYSDSDIEDPDSPPWADAQKELAHLYDLFVHHYGPVNAEDVRYVGPPNARGEQLTYKVYPNLREFREDPDSYLVASIEDFNTITGEALPGAIFTQRVVAPYSHVPRLKTAEEALEFCLMEKGEVDLGFMKELLGGKRRKKKIARELVDKNLMFLNPETEVWQPADIYLSGDVREKLDLAEEAAADDPRYEANVEALGSALPLPLTPADIDIALGMHWIPPEIIRQFAIECLGLEQVQVHYVGKFHSWRVYGAVADEITARHELGSEYRTTLDLLRSSLNNRQTVVNRQSLSSEANELQTEIAQSKQKEIEELFKVWVWSDEARAAQLCDIYNNMPFCRLVPPKITGRAAPPPGAAVSVSPRPHQANAIRRNIVSRDVPIGMLYAHEVGAGKTYAASWAAMEMKRLEKVDKPCFVVPNNMLVQFSRDYLKVNPRGNILVLEEDQFREDGQPLRSQDKLREFVKRAAGYEWDAIFITQSNFDALNTSPRVALQMLLDDIRECRALRYEDKYSDHFGTISYLFERASRQQNKLVRFFELEIDGEAPGSQNDKESALWREHFEELVNYDADHPAWDEFIDRISDPDAARFEDTGIDYLFIDEGQNYKNLEVSSRIPNMARPGSSRAGSLEQKLYYLGRKYESGNRISLMTGTPISNAISETYNMKRYMQPDFLKKCGFESFDAWIAMFGELVSAVEMAPEGNSYRVIERIAQYKNVPELMRMFQSFADIVLGDMLNLPLPKLKDDKHKIIEVPRNKKVAKVFEELSERADKVRDRLVDPADDNLLKITNEGRLATLHPKLVDPAANVNEPGKIEYLVEQLVERYEQNKDKVYTNDAGEPDEITGALQMVFGDAGVPGAADEFSVYHEVKRQLVAKGLPADSIRFIHDYDTDKKKAQLFEECRQGHVSVLIGTTQKLGTGTNVQKRLIAAHHLDAPWRPSDIIQRDGRIVRQGNQNDEVEVLRYVMKDSYDVFMWQTLERKIKFISQVMRGDISVRHLADNDETVLSYAEVKAAATGDKLVLEKADIENELANLKRLKMMHDHEVQRAMFHQRRIDHEMKGLQDKITRKTGIRDLMLADDSLLYPLQLGEETFDDAEQAGMSLKKIMRDVRKVLRESATGRSERTIGRLFGFPVRLLARVKVKEKAQDAEGNKDGKPQVQRDYRYKYKIKIGDPVHREVDYDAGDTRESQFERQLKHEAGFENDNETDEQDPAQTVAEAFDDNAQAVEQIKQSYVELADRLVHYYQNIDNALEKNRQTLAALDEELARIDELGRKPFEHQARFDKLNARLKEIDQTLLERTKQQKQKRRAARRAAIAGAGEAPSMKVG